MAVDMAGNIIPDPAPSFLDNLTNSITKIGDSIANAANKRAADAVTQAANNAVAQVNDWANGGGASRPVGAAVPAQFVGGTPQKNNTMIYIVGAVLIAVILLRKG